MPAKVTLKAVAGRLSGRVYEFDERTTCIVGRDTDCGIRLPEDDPTVSRNHCMLDINPPNATIRDFGSMNGTYVNGRKIGARDAGAEAQDAPATEALQHELRRGDEIGLGETTLRVEVSEPVYCEVCQSEIPEDAARAATTQWGTYRCGDCRAEPQLTQEGPGQTSLMGQETSQFRSCSKCGRDATDAPPEGHGIALCASCRSDPLAVVDILLDLAKSGGRADLVAIQGYSVERELGQGGMGAVYLARRDDTGELAALKVMLPKVAVRPAARDMFLREIENMKTLRHKNIVRLLDHGCSGGTFFMTLEYCAGGSVQDLIEARGGTLPLDLALDITHQILDGLAYAHAALVPNVKRPDGTTGQGQGLVHRDIKPMNVFLSSTGDDMVAKVADYGLAKAFDNAGLSGQTRTGNAAGSPSFIPRQQVVNYKYVKPEVDVWAAAATLYFMLAGTYPRNYPGDLDPWRITLQEEPVPIRNRGVKLPDALADVLDMALQDRPTLHFKTAHELSDALKGAVGR